MEIEQTFEIEEVDVEECLKRGEHSPVTIRFNPFKAFRWRRGKWQIEQRYHLTVSAAHAHGHDLVVFRHVDPDNGDFHSQHLGIERDLQIFFNHCKQTDCLFGVPIGIHDGLVNHLTETFPIRAGEARLWTDVSGAAPTPPVSR